MGYFCYSLVYLTLLSSSFTGAEIRNIRAVEGEDCTLPCSEDTTLELSDLEWSHSDLDMTLLVVRGGTVMKGYEDPLYRNRVELLDPELQTDLSVVLKDVTVKDSGVYECLVLYKYEPETSQRIHLSITERGTTNRLYRGLGIGLSLILVIVVLCVLFLKLFKHILCDSRKSSSSEKSKEHFISSLSSSASLSASSTLSDRSDAALMKKHPPPSPLPCKIEQIPLKPPPYSRSLPPSSPLPRYTLPGGRERPVLSRSVTSAPSWSCHLVEVEGLECSSPETQTGPGLKQDQEQLRPQSLQPQRSIFVKMRLKLDSV